MVHLPAREIPIPSSVSAEAQAVLAMPSAEAIQFPPLDDARAWKEHIAERDRMSEAALASMVGDDSVKADERDVEGVRVFVATPAGVDASDDRVYLDIHGGGFIYAGGASCRALAVMAASRYGARVWSPDYRMPPDHPYPAALDDCLAVYRELVTSHRGERVIIGGMSAGGNLAAALVLRARDEGLPMPAAAILQSPPADLTESGDSYQTNVGLDPRLRGSTMPIFLLYAAGQDLRHPCLSPVYGDFTKGFPPTLLTTGTRDLLLSDTVRLHRALRRAGVPAELHVIEAAGHGGFMGRAPEDREIAAEARRFADLHW